MRGAAATALSAVLLAPGCGPSAAPRPAEKEEPARRASYRSLAARDFLATCPGAAERRETAYQDARFAELKQLAARNGAGRAVALGENEWAGMRRYGQRTRCATGEPAYRDALAGYSTALDTLAAQIAAYARSAGARP